MQPERAELYFQQGSSDKVYHLQLEGAQDQWAAQAQWGRRGSALQNRRSRRSRRAAGKCSLDDSARNAWPRPGRDCDWYSLGAGR